MSTIVPLSLSGGIHQEKSLFLSRYLLLSVASFPSFEVRRREAVEKSFASPVVFVHVVSSLFLSKGFQSRLVDMLKLYFLFKGDSRNPTAATKCSFRTYCVNDYLLGDSGKGEIDLILQRTE